MVYITSELFGSDPRYDRSTSPATTHSQTWNTMVDTQHTAGLGKRKRRIDESEEGSSSKLDRPHRALGNRDANLAGYSNCSSQLKAVPTGRGPPRFHGHDPALDVDAPRLYPVTIATSSHRFSERRPVKQLRRLNPKVALVKSASHLMDIESDSTPGFLGADRCESHSHSDLRPCHACNAAPKRKRDLENYMECKRCDGRTCYICARECLGCQKAICKKCIVEVGEEGDPWCLECYSRHINS